MKRTVGELAPPVYALGSVDKTLRVMHMLRDGTPLRVTTVAKNLEIGVSTAHRIMAMLVFHGFAVQDSKRQYLPGPALGAPVLMARDVDRLLRISAPILEALAMEIGETVNLTLRVGPHTRVLLATGTNGRTEMDRSGAVHPAYATAAGRISLASVSLAQLEQLFRGPAADRAGSLLDDAAFSELLRELGRTRERGYAVSRAEAVKGISAVSMPVNAATTRAITVVVITRSSDFDALLEDESKMQLIRAAALTLGERLPTED